MDLCTKIQHAMTDIITRNNLSLMNEKHLKFLFSKIYSLFHSFGDLTQTKNQLYLKIMREVENESKGNSGQKRLSAEVDLSEEAKYSFNDLIELKLPEEYNKAEHDKKLNSLTELLLNKKMSEYNYRKNLSGSSDLIENSINTDLNLSTAINDNRQLTLEELNEIKLNHSISNNDFDLLLWILKKKKETEFENDKYDYQYTYNSDSLNNKGLQIQSRQEIEKDWLSLIDEMSYLIEK